MTASNQPISGPTAIDVATLDRHFRASNYLSVGQIYLVDNPLLDRPLEPDDIKRRLLGHWGTTPGINFVLTHLQRAIVTHDLDLLPIIGPGHGGPSMLANTWLDGSYSELYPEVPISAVGMRRLFRQFSFPRGVPSHVSPHTPGSIHEGGELGYSLAHAVGAVLDNPDLIAACIVGDGEAETGPLAASWQSTAFIDPVVDGAVLPILHLNDWKIANPTVLARRTEAEVVDYFGSMGWDPRIVTVGETAARLDDHRSFASVLDRAVTDIERIHAIARADDRSSTGSARWPMIVLRSPKGWTGPDLVDGEAVEGTWRSHQVPIDQVRDEPDRREALERWMRSYDPEELFDRDGRPHPDVVAWLPTGERRIGSNPHANGGRLLADLPLPDHRDHAVSCSRPGESTSEPTSVLAGYLREVMSMTADSRNFRLMVPDETASNRLDEVFETTGKQWQLMRRPVDEGAHLQSGGRVMEVLSEHLCQGWLEGYLLTGRHGLFSCYEAFVHIVDSMFNQHAKWLEVHRLLDWREPIASLNYLLTSHVWRQDHNGFSHQDPGFIDLVANKSSEVVRVYLPPDTNTLLVTMDRCLASRDLVNVVVSGKHPTPDWFDADEAERHCERGVGRLDFACSDHDGEPDVVLACAGDVPTVETLAAAGILRDRLPDLRVRVVNVVDLMRLQPSDVHPHGLPDDEFDQIFTTDAPVIFAFHGYPWSIHRLSYRRTNHHNFHVHGYQENGSTTTPFDMVVRNDVDRFRLVIDAIERTPAPAGGAADLRADMVDARERHVRHITEYGIDLPEVRDWRWASP
ncbi:MAG: phosphoketolase family protein [Ilumatobacteraceae bacterium]|nr:phosphoketolase family protein [Ilumatobacteraceae bacterium]